MKIPKRKLKSVELDSTSELIHLPHGSILSQLASDYIPTLVRMQAMSTHKSNLVELQEAMDGLSVRLSQSPDPSLTLSDLERIMSWKLARGKQRPGLMKLISSNEPDKVISITKDAFQAKWPESGKILCQLRGVGPATASGTCRNSRC